ncbi:hypothetical protein PsYK624_162590 [Phanerochaete sordida]|uniref:Uncharacterized protein n=1 Tax=Phanerochaete sordida TaxID=48140 RepID=A0A9P3GR48_9APHY|nr:hypothetical protein PsYK624_162590 [Phanerochaete sordida]
MLSTPPDADGSITDDLRVAVNICSPEDTQPHAAPSPAYVEKIVITSRAVDPSAATSVPWDVLNPIIVHPLFHTLRFEADRRDEAEYTTMRRILVTVLRGTHLHRALDSGKLRFGLVDDADEAAISRAEILAVPDTHTVYSTTLTLDVDQQAQWLLCDGTYSRNEYLQMLRAELAPDPPDYMVDANGDDVDDSTWVWAPSTAHVSQAGRDRSRTRYRENQRPVAGAAVGEDGPTSHASGLSLATSRSRAASV